MTTADAKVSFAWTATENYKHYPPYVNLTRNRLAVRGLEKVDRNGNPQPGEYVTVELPPDAISDLRAALEAPHSMTEAITDPMIFAGREYLLGFGIDDMDDAEIEGMYTAMQAARRDEAR
jgi:hypothetical protein